MKCILNLTCGCMLGTMRIYMKLFKYGIRGFFFKFFVNCCLFLRTKFILLYINKKIWLHRKHQSDFGSFVWKDCLEYAVDKKIQFREIVCALKWFCDFTKKTPIYSKTFRKTASQRIFIVQFLPAILQKISSFFWSLLSLKLSFQLSKKTESLCSVWFFCSFIFHQSK